MSTTLNRATYERMIEEDIDYLERQPRTLERDHAIQVLRDSVRKYFGVVADVDVEIEHARTHGFTEDHDDMHTVAELLQLVSEQLQRAQSTRGEHDAPGASPGNFLLPATRRYLIRVAATAIATIESIDRRTAGGFHEAR